MPESVDQSSLAVADQEAVFALVDDVVKASLDLDPVQRAYIAGYLLRASEVLSDNDEAARIKEEVKE